MTILHLGVIDLPYAEPTETKPKKVAQARRGKANKPLGKKEPAQSSNQTTGDVAEILEAKYHIMEIFFESYADNITDAIEHSLVNAVETLFTHNGPPPDNPYAGAASEIGEGFKLFLSSSEMEEIGYPGVPTEAALKGVNHRLKHPYAKGNPRRPSFIDTGTYEASFIAWVDD